MADCPVCGSRLTVVKWRWFTNMLGLTKPYFICPACDWRMNVEEVHRRGGLFNIRPGSKQQEHKEVTRPKNINNDIRNTSSRIRKRSKGYIGAHKKRWKYRRKMHRR